MQSCHTNIRDELMPAQQVKRIAIFDFDAHHGNGTQEAFETDDRVLFISVHQVSTVGLVSMSSSTVHCLPVQGLTLCGIVRRCTASATLYTNYKPPPLFPHVLEQANNYPANSGKVSECGSGEGENLTINVPLPAGSGKAAYAMLLDSIVVPAFLAFKPDLVGKSLSPGSVSLCVLVQFLGRQACGWCYTNNIFQRSCSLTLQTG